VEKGNTKQEILQAALDLFSAQGYDATSVSQIADAVGIRKATVYSHYAGKQDILNALLRTTLTEYERRSLFAQTDWDDPSCTGGRGDSPHVRAAARASRAQASRPCDPYSSIRIPPFAYDRSGPGRY